MEGVKRICISFLKRKFNLIKEPELSVFASQKGGEVCFFLFPVLIGGEGIGNPEGGFLIVSILP